MAKKPGVKYRTIREKKWKVLKRIGRRYLGVIISSSNYSDFSKEERRFHQKHLKAFLKGDDFFKNGVRREEVQPFIFVRKPVMEAVQFEYVDFFGNPIKK